MNIFFVIILLSLQDAPSLPEYSRANRRAARGKAISHNRKIQLDRGCEPWFESPDEDGVYRRYSSGNYHTKAQQGRWATERLSGHRRFQKWSRDAYPSFVDEKATARWQEELDEYFN